METEREQIERLAEWLSTCPITEEPICYLKPHYESVQVLYDDLCKAFSEAKVEDDELVVYIGSIRIFCLINETQKQNHLSWEDLV
jgi:hypothetical protein